MCNICEWLLSNLTLLGLGLGSISLVTEMAGAGAKKRLEENRARLRLLQILLISGIAAQILLLCWRSAGTWAILACGGTSAAAVASYMGIASLASPVYDDKGALIDGGADLNRVETSIWVQWVLQREVLTSLASCCPGRNLWLPA